MTTTGSLVRIFVALCLVCSVAGAADGGSTVGDMPGQLPATIGGCTGPDPLGVSCDGTPTGDVNLDGSINILDIVLLIDYVQCDVELTPEQIIQGNVDGDCLVELSDVYYLIAYLYEEGPALQPCNCTEIYSCRCTPTGDVNCDDSINILDIVLLINYVQCDVELTPEQVIQGDVDGDCLVELPDVEYLIASLYEEGPAPVPCMCSEKDSCRCTPTGDVNQDESINILDIVMLINFLNCTVELTPEQLIQGDVNGDCLVELPDVEYLIASLYEEGPAPAPCMCSEKEVPVCP
ncbi:MAG: hypothetical protein GY856_20875 [bacterium]|nr:hypothetical protein [bacterium]